MRSRVIGKFCLHRRGHLLRNGGHQGPFGIKIFRPNGPWLLAATERNLANAAPGLAPGISALALRTFGLPG